MRLDKPSHVIWYERLKHGIPGTGSIIAKLVVEVRSCFCGY